MAQSILSLFYSNYCLTKYSNDNPWWVNFVTDHYQLLRDEASIINIEPEDMETYRFRLADFLGEKNYDRHTTWVVLLINQLRSEKEFSNVSSLRIPNHTTLVKLRAQYDTYHALLESIKG